MSTNAVLRLVTLVVCLIGISSMAVAGGPLDLLTLNRVEADPNKSYRLSEENGPWLIMACSFSGEEADQQAHDLVLELRSRYKLPAYTFNKEFDFTKGTVTRGVDPYGAPLRMRHKRGNGTVECAVLVGEFPAIDDKKAQTTLKRIKLYKPDCLELDKSRPTYRSLAGVREFYKTVLPSGNKKKDRGPMGHAFVIPNPLLPKDYFAAPGVDDLIVKLNKSNKYSLLDCPGRYTVQVAKFTGNVTINQKEIQELEGSKKRASDRLDKAADTAEKLTWALRDKGYEAYTLHERYASIVTVGGFNSLGTTRPDGQVDTKPEILALIERFKATKAPELFSPGQTTVNMEAKSLAGIPFDPQPVAIRVPKRSIGSVYTANRSSPRSLR